MLLRQSSYLLVYPALITLLVPSNAAFTFSFSSQPTQCQSLTAQWSGGSGPYRLFLIPVGHVNPEMRTIVNMAIPANQTSASISSLLFPENSQFVAVMSDSTGFGTGGTSTIYTVGSGSSSCLPTSPSKADFFMYFSEQTTPSQCGSFPISWDSGVAGVHIYGVIPGGQSFDLGAPTSGTNFHWTTNVRQGTEMLFLAVGGNGENGGSTDVATVSGGSSGCINAQSPSSTANPPAGGVSTAAPAATSANPSQQPGGSATGGTGATAGAGATGTAGNSGSPDPTATNSGASYSGGVMTSAGSQASVTRGSNGGTVTGDPNLPVATDNSMSGRRSLNLGAIIGGTLGGIAAILIVVLVWLLCARRRRRENGDEDSERLVSRARASRRRTDLLADSIPIMHQSSGSAQDYDWFRAEPFVPPMTAEEFARRTGGQSMDREEREEEYHDDPNPNPSGSSLSHGAVTNSSVAAAMYGALARTPSYSTSGHGHQRSAQLSHSRLSHSRSQSLSNSHSHSHNVSHSPAHSSSRHGPYQTHSRSFSNPFSSMSMTPGSNVSRTRGEGTPPTPLSAADPFATAVTRPPPSSWNNQASGSSGAVPRVRRSTDSNRAHPERKSGEEPRENEPDLEGDIVDLPPSYASLRSRRVVNP